MDDKMKNNLFLVAVDYIFEAKLASSQKDLAHKMGITETSLSRIKKGQRVVSDDTLRKMNEAFNHIFNMQYFRGRSSNLLVEDEKYYEQQPDEDPFNDFDRTLHESEKTAYQPIPKWADNLIDILSQQIKENEALHRELRQSITEVNAIRTDLQTLLKKLKK